MKLASAIALAALFLAQPVFAHKHKTEHSHCSVKGKGVEVKGKSDDEQKANCSKIADAVWSETTGYAIGGPAFKSNDNRLPADSAAR